MGGGGGGEVASIVIVLSSTFCIYGFELKYGGLACIRIDLRSYSNEHVCCNIV